MVESLNASIALLPNFPAVHPGLGCRSAQPNRLILANEFKRKQSAAPGSTLTTVVVVYGSCRFSDW